MNKLQQVCYFDNLITGFPFNSMLISFDYSFMNVCACATSKLNFID